MKAVASAEVAGLPAASLALNCVGGSASLAIAKRLRCVSSLNQVLEINL